MADIVLNNIDGLKRTFVDDTRAPSVSPEMQKLIHDANFIAGEGFKRRYSQLASPTFVYQEPEGAVIFNGYKPWETFTGALRPWDHQITDLSRELAQILSEEKRISPSTRVGIRRITALHALPHTASASFGCSDTGQYNAVAEVRYQDADWVKIQAFFSLQGEPIYAYVEAQDIVFA